MYDTRETYAISEDIPGVDRTVTIVCMEYTVNEKCDPVYNRGGVIFQHKIDFSRVFFAPVNPGF